VLGLKITESCETGTWLARLFDPLDNDAKVSSAVAANILKDGPVVNETLGCESPLTESLWKVDCPADTSSEPGNGKLSKAWGVYKPESTGLDLPVTSDLADDIYGA
jgi:hypothetical protein